MNWKRIALLALVGLAIVGIAVWAGRPHVAAGTPTPEEITQRFYDWYLDYTSGEEFRNALRDKAYMTSPYLTEAFKVEVEETVASWQLGGADPFLCAQDVPTSVTVGTATVSGDIATVPVTTSFEGHGFTVTLERTGDSWLIAGVTPQR